jgi:hypothetical protein
MVERRVLTKEERSRSYARLYDKEMAPVPQSILDTLGKGPLDPAKALPATRLNDLLNPGYLEGEVGYCVMPDGSGYVAMLTQMPGVTAEMFDWWFVWHPLEDLRYAIWAPGCHISAFLSESDRAKHLDESIPVHKRNWGSRHCIVEWDPKGMPMSALEAVFMSPEDCGFDMSRFKPSAVSTVVCSNCGPRGHKEDLMCHFLREVPGGSELRSRFWMGKTIRDRRVVDVPIPPEMPLEMAVRSLSYHCAAEFHNLASILPGLYREQGGAVAA